MKLARNGFDVNIFDAKNKIGGRFFSFKESKSGEIIDNGQHIMMGVYETFLEFLNLLGTIKNLKFLNSPIFPFFYTNGDVDILQSKFFSGKLGFLLGILTLKKLSYQSKFNVLKLFAIIQFNRCNAENLTTEEFLIKYGQGKEIISKFWEPIVLATMNTSPQIASAKLFVSIIKKAFFTNAQNSSVILPQVGFSELLEPFNEMIKKFNGSINLNTNISQIQKNGEYWTVRTKDGRTFSSVFLVSAVNANSLEKILKNSTGFDSIIKIIENYDYSPILSVYLWFDKNFIDYDFVAVLDSPIQWIFNRRKFIISNDGILNPSLGHISITISNSNNIIDLPNDDIIEISINEIKKCFPKVGELNLLNYKIIKEKKATIIIDPEVEKNRINNVTKYQNFFIAGDWTNTELPATLESASKSGAYVADIVKKSFFLNNN